MGAIGILYLQGGFANIAAAGGGVGHALAAVVVFLGKGHAQVLPGVSHGRPVMQVLYQAVLLHQEDEGGVLRLYGNHLPLYGGNGYGLVGEFFGFSGLSVERKQQERCSKEKGQFHVATIYFLQDMQNFAKKEKSM